MDIGLILSAALIGFSFSNSFMCMVVAMSTSLGRGLKAGIGFLGGRIAGIISFGIIMALFGFLIEIDTRTMLNIFGGLTMIFGLFILIFPNISRSIGLVRNCETGICEECREGKGTGPAVRNAEHDCSACPASMRCSESRKVGELIGSGVKGKTWADFDRRFEKYGMTGATILGFIRGATPCVKIILLLPLIISLPFSESLAVTSTYALSSSLYPIIGIAIASILGDIFSTRFRKYLTRVGALTMVVIGGYFLYKAWTYSCTSGI